MKTLNINLSNEDIFEILENIYNEVYVVDKNMNIIYVNPSCCRNYGLLPTDMIGKNHEEFTGDLWYPSVLKDVFIKKKRLCVEQMTYLGKTIISTANPVLDKNNDIEMIVCLTEEKFSTVNIDYDPNSKVIEYNDIASKESIKVNKLNTVTQITTINKNMIALLETAITSAKKDIPILIQGESGTGKSMLAKYIHEYSPRVDGPFISLNCATIPNNLLESELFGYEPHSFSGANPKGKIGLIETANNGTLFLDEIAELALSLQAKLLEVIENKSFIPVGGTKVKEINIRIITATNQNLQEMISKKTFREDLYWRLNVVDFELPPLRERSEDIIPLINLFLKNSFIKNKIFSKEALNILTFYQWPGNIRQLKNIVDRAVILASDDTIRIDDLPFNIVTEVTNSDLTSYDYDSYMELCEKNIIIEAYKEYSSSRKLAEYLNISQSKANNLIKKYIKTD